MFRLFRLLAYLNAFAVHAHAKLNQRVIVRTSFGRANPSHSTRAILPASMQRPRLLLLLLLLLVVVVLLLLVVVLLFIVGIVVSLVVWRGVGFRAEGSSRGGGPS